MSRIITFLGKACSGQTMLAIATAKWFAQQGKRVLYVVHNPSHQAERWLETSLQPTPQSIAPNLQAVQLQSTGLLEQSWEEIKKWLTLYLPDSVSIDIYPAEVVILPGFDSILAFNALRIYYESNDYDVILYDGAGNLETLRMMGIPDVVDWYFRRFHQIFDALDLNKIADSIGGPLASAFLAANIDQRKMKEGLAQVKSWIAQGVSVLGDANRLTAYLVTTNQVDAIAETQWLWGSAQQVDLRVSGVLVYGGSELSQIDTLSKPDLQQSFDPLPVSFIPPMQSPDWEVLLQALPDFTVIPPLPEPVAIDIEQRQVRVFLPGFSKHQVRLNQLGSELTVEAGDQRRNIFLPPELQGLTVTAGKFEAPYLLISL